MKKSSFIAGLVLVLSCLLVGCEAVSQVAMMAAANSKSISVYGKVIDQNGNPIADVKVRGGVLLNQGYASSGSYERDTQTDKQGRFKFIGLHGIDFGCGLEKPGYEYNTQLYTTWWNSYKPDPNNPMVFTMYKLQGAEPMVHSKFAAWIPYDGTPVSIDLFTGKKSDSGDLKVTLLRNPINVVRGRDHFDWNVKVEVVGGGLVESHDTYPYEAPDRGLQSGIEFSQAKDAPAWTPGLVGAYYVHTSKGDYGRIHFDLRADSDRPEGTGLEIEAWMNPSGSRNLEWDPAKEIKPGARGR